MAKIELIYPQPLYPIYGNSVTFRYKIKEVLQSDNVKKIVFKIGDDLVFESNTIDNFYIVNNLTEGTHKVNIYLLDDKNKKVKGSDQYTTIKVVNKQYKPERKISQLVSQRVPEFIQNDHPRFVKFVEAYYEWLESSNNPYYMNFASGDFFDIDKTPDIFINDFRTQYLNNFPEKFATNLNGDTVNVKTLIKNVRQFYNAKGSEKSFKFFFRLLYDTFVDIYYPKNDILRASESRWKERKTIKILSNDYDVVNDLKGKIIYQATRDRNIHFTARVVSVQVYKSEELSIAELEIMNENGTYDHFGKLYCDLEDSRLSASIIQVINNVTVVNSGFGYKEGETIDLNWNSTDTIPLKGKSAKAKIVKVGEKGNIIKVQMMDTGSFNISTTTSSYGSPEIIINTQNGGNAILTADYSGMSIYPGYYSTKQGHISLNKKLQDNRRYQDLSYVLRTDITLNNYIVLLKKLVHPAGFYVGGDVILKGEYDNLSRSGNGLVTEFRNYIGNFIAYRLDCNFDVRNFNAPPDRIDLYLNGYGDIFPRGFDPNDTIPQQTIDQLDDGDSVIVHNGDGIGQLTEGVETIFYGNTPDVSDFSELNNYWVVFPHPDATKAFNELTILEFAINNKNDVLFRLENG